MSEHRYILEPYGGKDSRYNCPSCKQKEKTFVRYIDAETGNHINPAVGRCNRESNCGYHFTPEYYFKDNPKPVKGCLVQYEKIEPYSEKSLKVLTTEGETYYLPKSQILQINGNSCWVNVWFLEQEEIPTYDKEMRIYDPNRNISEPPVFLPARQATIHPNPKKSQHKAVSFIPAEVFKTSLKSYDKNYFVRYLINLFGIEVTNEIVSRYFIATSNHWNGASVFWQIDTQGKVRTGKIMLYCPDTGKRVKKPFSHINWVHSLLKQPDFELKQCLFGEHLLNFDKIKPVAIVESEKTAVIASIYLPQFIWVAVGSLANLNIEKCSILKGRKIILFPDLNGFDKWSNKAKELSSFAIFSVSDLLERKATEEEREKGFDLADYLVKLDWRQFSMCDTDETIHNIESSTIAFTANKERGSSEKVANCAPKLIHTKTYDSVTNEAILSHYKSYRMPYDVINTEDLKSLVSGFMFETGIKITGDSYKVAVLNHKEYNNN